MSKKQQRIPLRSFPNPKVKLQYLVFPYANFSVPSLGGRDSFEIGPFVLWRDTDKNWLHFQQFPRPSTHLTMYVGRDGKPISTLWVAAMPHSKNLGYISWQHLAAALFYIAWARIPFSTVDRPAAEDFYMEAFVLPEGAAPDYPASALHVQFVTCFAPLYGQESLEFVSLGSAVRCTVNFEEVSCLSIFSGLCSLCC